MPQRPSAKKSVRQNKKRQLRNKSVRSRLTTETRKFERAIERGDLDAARQQLDVLTKLLQQAATKGVLHQKTAGRRQARYQKRLNEAAAQSG